MTTQPPDGERPYRVPRRRRPPQPPPSSQAAGDDAVYRVPRRSQSRAPAPLTGPLGTEPTPPRPSSAQPPLDDSLDTSYIEDDEDYYDEYEYEEPQPFLRNPFVLASLAVGAAIVLAVLVALFSGNGGLGSDGNANARPTATLEAGAVGAQSISSATVREGPGLDFLEIGVLPRGQEVQVIGRTEDASWFQIYYPANSRLKGWVPDTALNVPQTVFARIEVTDASTEIDRPTVEIPTEVPADTAVPVVETETPTPEPAGGPDLAVSIYNNDCTAGGELVITVGNAGLVTIEDRQIAVTVVSPDAEPSILGAFLAILEPGQTINLPTGLPVSPPRTTVQVDLLDPPLDVNGANNVAVCVAPSQPDEAPGVEEGEPTPEAEETP